MEYPPAHVGSPDHQPSPHATYPADDLVTKVNELAKLLKLEWCAPCHTWHQIAGGSRVTDQPLGSVMGGESTMTSAPPGI